MKFPRGFTAKSLVGICSIAILVSARPVLAQSHIDESAVKQVLHVDAAAKTASDSNPGTAESPLKSLSGAVKRAVGKPTRILIHAGVYREYVKVEEGSDILILESVRPGAAILSGSEVYDQWTKDSSGVLSHAWSKSWGLGNENGWWGSTAYNRRREMVFVNGQRMQQVCDEQGKPVETSRLNPGEFTVQDAAEAEPGKIWLNPPAAAQLQPGSIEVTERGVDSGYTIASRPLLEVAAHSNLILRGLVVRHCANYIKFGPAVHLIGGFPKDADRLPSNVLVENCLITQNNGIGMEISNYRDVTVRHSQFNENGERGAGSVQVGNEPEHTPGTVVKPRNYLFEDCQFNSNNWRMVGTWGDMNDSAGFKMFGQNINGYTFLRCQFNRNLANGFWQDYGGSNVVLDHCIAEENRGGAAGGYGVLNEMTRGPFTLRHCLIRNNGNSGFISSGAPGVVLENNVICYNSQDVKFNDQRLYGHEIKINSDTKRGDGDFQFSLKGWTLTGNVLASFGNPIGKGSIFMIGGEDFPSGRSAAAEFASEIRSDGNTFSKDDVEKDYFPGRKVMYSLTAKNGPPDIDLPTWQQQKNEHGLQDGHSKFAYPLDLSKAPDPTLQR